MTTSQTMSEVEGFDTQESQNLLFDALSNHRRRFALYACNEAEGALSLANIAEQVAAWEYGKDISEVTSTERKRIYTSLQQHHLDKLENAGLIEIDRDMILLTDKARNIELYLDVVTSDTIPWSMYYLGLGIIAAVGIAIVALFELPGFVTMELVAVTIVVMFLISAVIHLLDTRSNRLAGLNPPEAFDD